MVAQGHSSTVVPPVSSSFPGAQVISAVQELPLRCFLALVLPRPRVDGSEMAHAECCGFLMY